MENVGVHIGKKAGGVFMPSLEAATQRLWILSPWISEEHTDLLIHKKQAGVDVRLFTTNDTGNNSKALGKLLEDKERVVRPERIGLIAAAVVSFITGIVLANEYSWWLFFVGTIAAMILYKLGIEISETYYISRLGDGLRIFQFNQANLLHAKVYIADNVAIFTSANFTHNGFERSVEATVEITDRDIADQTCRQIAETLASSNLQELSYDTVAMNIEVSTQYKKQRHYRRYRRW